MLWTSLGVAAEQAGTGQAIYQMTCAECHGARGEGVADAYPDPLQGERTLEALTKIINDTMPDGEPQQCSGESARQVAAYIYENFYTAAARERNRPLRIELSRLTVRQYAHAVTDLVGSFVGEAKLDEQRGIRGRYYNAKSFQGDKQVFERIDDEIAFDFGGGSPDEKRIGKEEFSIQWQGGLIAEETGDYEFCLTTDNGARLWVNDDRKPLIDAWVKSGDDTQHRASVRLLGGRVYPIRLDYFKFKSKSASVSLCWQPPQRAEQVISRRHLSPGWFPPSLVVETQFPPDDSSVGYERGTSISQAWEQATTYAAVEVANRVVDHLEALSKCKADAPDRPQQLQEFCYRFAERAFRRPLTDEQKQFFVDARFAGQEDLEFAVRQVVILVLKSPRFLYLEIGGGDQVDDYDVASRLSFGLWDSLPDQALLDAAARGQVRTPEQVAAQAERMLAGPRARSKLRYFFHKWLNVERFADMSKDQDAFPNFNQAVASDLLTSLDIFLDETVWSDASDFRQLLLADTVYVNDRLAEFYGIEVAADGGFQKVSLGPGPWAGLLTHPCLTTGFSYFKSTSPIHRGVFVIRSLLGRALRPPPIAVAPLDEGEDPTLTTRERVALQTKSETCQSCHAMINPLGFALENFDAVGRYRSEEKGRPIDATGSYQPVSETPVTFGGARELAEYLAGSEEVHRCFAEQLFHSIVKQPVNAYGPDQLSHLEEFFAASDFNVQQLLVEIMRTTALQTR